MKLFTIMLLLSFLAYIDAQACYLLDNNENITCASSETNNGVSVSNKRYNRIVIDKQCFTLTVFDNEGKDIYHTICGVGLNHGQKKKSGDKRTPEGIFKIKEICNSKNWIHDFQDGHGARKGAYGPYFIRLKVDKFSGIGIHGTCFPMSIGSRCSDGCIRLKNEDVIEILKYVKIGDYVEIKPD